MIHVCVYCQMTASKDFVVHMVATPALSDEGSGDVEPPCKRWLTVDAIDEQYIVNHARQVQSEAMLTLSHSLLVQYVALLCLIYVCLHPMGTSWCKKVGHCPLSVKKMSLRSYQ